MNVDDLISRATHTSGRTLLAVSSTVLLADHFEHSLSDFPLLATANDMPNGMIEFAALALISYLMFAHILNWMPDRTSYVTDHHKKAYEDYLKIDRGMGNNNPTDGSEYFDEFGGLLKKQLARQDKIANITQFLTLYVLHLLLPASLGIYSATLLLIKGLETTTKF